MDVESLVLVVCVPVPLVVSDDDDVLVIVSVLSDVASEVVE